MLFLLKKRSKCHVFALIPLGFGSGLYKAFCEEVEESESEDTSSGDQKEESESDYDSDSSSDTW